MAEILKELKKAKLDPEDKVEEAESRPTAELASEIREAQVEASKNSESVQQHERTLTETPKGCGFYYHGGDRGIENKGRRDWGKDR